MSDVEHEKPAPRVSYDAAPPAAAAVPAAPTEARAPRPPSAWNLANTLTVTRILLVPVFGWLLLADGGTTTGYRMAAFAVFTIAAITDKIDGDLARARNSVTDFGKVTDPIADKTLTGMALVGLSVIGELPWWITVVILVRELGVTVMRFVVIRHGVMPASRGGKLKTLLQGIALGMLIFPAEVLTFADGWMLVARVVLSIALVVTVVTGLDYAVKAHILRRTSARAVAKRAARAARAAERSAERRG